MPVLTLYWPLSHYVLIQLWTNIFSTNIGISIQIILCHSLRRLYNRTTTHKDISKKLYGVEEGQIS